jgi:hypothetical protein
VTDDRVTAIYVVDDTRVIVIGETGQPSGA